MNCPMCGKEMISGVVQSDREVLDRRKQKVIKDNIRSIRPFMLSDALFHL